MQDYKKALPMESQKTKNSSKNQKMKSTNFLNIFPKKTLIIKKPIKEKIKVFVDYREKNCLVPASLINLNLEVEFKELKVADYIINNVAIERKTISDFLSSMTNRRLIKQLEELQQYPLKLLIIEGFEEQELYNDEEHTQFRSEAFEETALQQQKGKSKKTARLFLNGIHPNSIRGFLLSIVLKYKTPIIFTKNERDTAKFISVIARKKSVEQSLNIKKKTLSKKERLQFILESFPGIGPSTAKKLLKEFGTIQNIIDAPQEELKKIIGKKAEIFKLIEEEY